MRIFALVLLLLCASVGRAQPLSPLDASLFAAAVRQSDVARTRSLLARGANPNARAPGGETIFDRALTAHQEWTEKDAQIIKLLLANGANPNALQPNQSTSLSTIGYQRDKFLLVLNAPAKIKPDREMALVLAASAQWTEIVDKLLREGVDVNALAGGTRPLIAASAGRVESMATLELLLRRGASVNAPDKNGNTALMEAVDYGGNDAVVRRLLAAGAQIEMRDKVGKTPLLRADRLATVELLLRAGADVNARSHQGETLLMSAASRPVEWVRLVLAYHPDLNVRDDQGETALMKAAKFEDGAALALIHAGADLNARDAQGLDVVARTGNALDLSVVDALLAADSVSTRQRAQLQRIRLELMLLQASAKQNTTRANDALKSDANPNARNRYGKTPLLLAIQDGRDDQKSVRRAKSAELTRLLLQNGADPNLGVQGNRWSIPIMKATNDVPVLELLLESGASVDGRDWDGYTALMWLCAYRETTLPSLRLLLAHGAAPNARNADGDTPLTLSVGSERHFGSWGGERLEFALLLRGLIAAGADVNAANNRGQTVLMKAAYAQLDDIARDLLASGADVNARDKEGQSALMKASQVLITSGRSSGSKNIYYWPSASMVRLLLADGADVNARDRAGQSALIWLAKGNARDFSFFLQGAEKQAAIEKRNAQIADAARLLIENGADVSLNTNNGNTALKWAKVRGNKPLIELLKNAGAK